MFRRMNHLRAIVLAILMVLPAIGRTAQREGEILVKSRIAPAAIEVILESRSPFEISSQNLSGTTLLLTSEDLSVTSGKVHKITDVPLIDMVVLEPSSPNGSRVRIELDRSASYSLLSDRGGRRLIVHFTGDVIEEISYQLYSTAEEHRLAGDEPAALESYRKAIRIKGGLFPAAYFGVGLIRADLEQHKLAIGAFKKALLSDELAVESHRKLSSLFQIIGKDSLAKEHELLAEVRPAEEPDSTVIKLSPEAESALKSDLVTAGEMVLEEVRVGEEKKFSGYPEKLMSWEVLRVLLLVIVLLSPIMMVLVLGRKTKVRKNSRRTASSGEFAENLNSAVRKIEQNINIQRTATEAREKTTEIKTADRKGNGSVGTREKTSLSSALLQTMAWENRSQVQSKITHILSLSKQRNDIKTIAQQLGISENEVNLALELGRGEVDISVRVPTNLSRIATLDTGARDIARDLHRSEEEVRLELLTEDHMK